MFLTKLKAVALAGLVLAAGIWSAGLPGGSGAVAGQPAPPDPAVPTRATPDEQTPRPAAKPAGPGTLLLAREGGFVALTPEGEEGDELTVPKDTRSWFRGRLSPDRTRVAFVVLRQEPPRSADDDRPWPYRVVVRKFGAADPAAVADFSVKGLLTVCWAPDGKKVLVTADPRGDGSLENVLVDAETGKTGAIDLPADVRVLDWSRDGKTFLVLYRKDKKYRLGLADGGDKEVRDLTELKVRTPFTVFARFSPDGTKVLFTDADPEEKDAFRWHRSSRPHVLDVATKRRNPLAEFPGKNAECLGVAWSPDGKRVAYTWTQLHPGLLKKDTLQADESMIETEAFLVVADADGKNQETVATGKCANAVNRIFGSVDWR